ncbi:hypothetical protein ACLI4U_09445 [Natrialbaceae archaeon A-CW2]
MKSEPTAERTSRRRLLEFGLTAGIFGLAGCMGSDDGSDSTNGDGDSGDTTDDGNGSTSGATGESPHDDDGIFLHDTLQTGYYQYGVVDNSGQGITDLVWNVTAVDGRNGTVDAVVRFDDGTEETHSISTVADPDLGLAFENGFEYMDLGFQNRSWFPGDTLSGFDLSELAAGEIYEHPMPTFGGEVPITVEAIGTETYAGLEGYVVQVTMDEPSSDLEPKYEYCISVDHAIVLRGTDGIEEDRRRPIQEITLVEHGPAIDIADRPALEEPDPPAERGATSDGSIRLATPGYYRWDREQDGMAFPLQIAIEEPAEEELSAVTVQTFDGNDFDDSIEGTVDSIGGRLFGNQGLGTTVAGTMYEVIGNHADRSFTVGEEYTQAGFRYVVEGTETVAGLEGYRLAAYEAENDQAFLECRVSLETGLLLSATSYDSDGEPDYTSELVERSDEIPEEIADLL